MNASITGYMDALHDAGQEVLLARLKIENIKRDLVKAETALMAAKERAREAQQVLCQVESTQVREEITSREVEIARMKGIVLNKGDKLTRAIKQLLRETPALPQFKAA